MLDMILGLAGAAVGLLLFAAGRYTARLGPIAAKRRAAISRESPSRRPEDGPPRPLPPLPKEDWRALYNFLHYDGGEMPPPDEQTGKDG